MTELEKMIAGKIYDAGADALPEMRAIAHKLCAEYNATLETEEKSAGKFWANYCRKFIRRHIFRGQFFATMVLTLKSAGIFMLILTLLYLTAAPLK